MRASPVLDSRPPAPQLELRVPIQVYGLETVKKAAYKFTDRASFSFVVDRDEIVCHVVLKPGRAASEADEFRRAFDNELLDQDLRRIVSEETGDIRNAVLAYAFSRSGLQRNE
ncbi:His-Xaa-Ser system protein HxsD [bacterium]|nr:MAG: His-Xaa-Ser system protein HxsD [bacterium]